VGSGAVMWGGVDGGGEVVGGVVGWERLTVWEEVGGRGGGSGLCSVCGGVVGSGFEGIGGGLRAGVVG